MTTISDTTYCTNCGHEFIWHDAGDDDTPCWRDDCKCKQFKGDDVSLADDPTVVPEEKPAVPVDTLREVGKIIVSNICTCGHTLHVHTDTKDCNVPGCGCKTVALKCAYCLHPAYMHNADTGVCLSEGCMCGVDTAVRELANDEPETGTKRVCVCKHTEKKHEKSWPYGCKKCKCKQFDLEGVIMNASTSAVGGGKHVEHGKEVCTVQGCGHTRFAHALTKDRKDGQCQRMGCACKEYMGINKDADDSVTPAGGTGYSGYNGWTGGTTYYKSCSHKPQMIVDGKTWSIWAGTKHACMDSIGEFDVILNCANMGPVTYKHKVPFKWFEKYMKGPTEIEMDWPDQGVPGDLPAQFWLDLVAELQKGKQKMLAFCIGGHGRTGTAIAALMMACDYTYADAKKFIHKNYCKSAIESTKQEDYLKRLDKDFAEIRKEKGK